MPLAILFRLRPATATPLANNSNFANWGPSSGIDPTGKGASIGALGAMLATQGADFAKAAGNFLVELEKLDAEEAIRQEARHQLI